MDSYEKSLQTLELPAVLALLAAQAVVKKGGLIDKCPVEGYSETRADSQAAPPLGTIQF